MQIALTKAIRKLHTYRGESALFTWLCAITRNEMSDWLAKQGRYRQHIVLTEDFPEIQPGLLAAIIACRRFSLGVLVE